VKLLEAEPILAPQAAPAPETPSEQPQSPPQATTACRACGASMAPDQDWCLSCGTAAPGTLGARPGWRAASTVIALTLLLVLGAIGASYAALSDDAKKPTPAPAPAAAVPPAQTAPPGAQPAQPATPAPTPTQATPSKPQASDNAATLPKVKAPSSSAKGAPVSPARPSTTTPSTSATTTPAPPPKPAGPVAVDVAQDAGSIYDPYSRALASGETARALDGDRSTSWYVDPKDATQAGVGYAVKLDQLRGIREIRLQTPTPGFRIEVYATDEETLPPDILDTRWSHIKDVSDVGVEHDGKQRIVLGAGTSQYRNLLLWFTRPPAAAPRLRLTELRLLG
jgi:hypothetical protein